MEDHGCVSIKLSVIPLTSSLVRVNRVQEDVALPLGDGDVVGIIVSKMTEFLYYSFLYDGQSAIN